MDQRNMVGGIWGGGAFGGPIQPTYINTTVWLWLIHIKEKILSLQMYKN